MAINFDTRPYEFTKNFNPDQVERTVQNTLPEDHRIKIRGVNSFLGSAQQVYSTLTGHDYIRPIESVPLSDNQLLDLAQKHLKQIAPALGLLESETPEFVPDPYIKTTPTGERILNFQQYYRGIPIFQMERTVWMETDGTIYNVVGTSVGLPADLDPVPNVTVEQALVAAVTYLISSSRASESEPDRLSFRRFNLKNYRPKVLAKSMLPSQPSVVERKQLGQAVPAHLVFFYQGEVTKLGWHLLISAPKMVEQYIVIVDARIEANDPQGPQVLYSQTTSHHLAPISGNVWVNNPTLNVNRQFITFPRPKTDYPNAEPPPLPTGFPFPWLDGDLTKAGGNFTIVLEGIDQELPEGLPEAVALDLNPTELQGARQRVLNAFFFCNFMHDFFYNLGFNEGAQNFQRVNENGEGKDGDPVIVRISARSLPGIGQLLTLADGSRTVLNMGPHPRTTNHGALDADAIFHEYTHGVTNRRVGSQSDPQPLQRPQSNGMAEGWSDYFALTIQNYYLPADQERVVFGNWISGDDAGGLRNCRYDDQFARDAEGQFGAIGRPRPANIRLTLERSHDIGRIWCAALMKMNRDLGSIFGRQEGHLLGWQIVFAGLQFTNANPTYILGRDSIIQALKGRARKGLLSTDQFPAAFRAVWKAFMRFGIGPDAISPTAELSPIIPDANDDDDHVPQPTLQPFDPV